MSSNTPPLQISNIKNFVYYKGWDIISDLEYKKYVSKSRESSEPWAHALHKDIQVVTAQIKNITNQILHLKEIGKERLFLVCEHVMTHVNPPCKTRKYWNVCIISGIHNNQCIDLSVNTRGDMLMTVHVKFSHFLSMLWLVTRFDHICKVLARKWLHSQTDVDTVDMKTLCDRYKKNNDFVEPLCRAFLYATQHVAKSLQQYSNTRSYEYFKNLKSKATENNI